MRQREAVFPGHERLVNRVCWHPLEAPILFSGSQDGTVRMWDVRQRNGSILTYTNDKSTSPIRDVQVCPLNPNVFASASDDGYLVIWDIRKGKEVTHARSGMTLILYLFAPCLLIMC